VTTCHERLIINERARRTTTTSPRDPVPQPPRTQSTQQPPRRAVAALRTNPTTPQTPTSPSRKLARSALPTPLDSLPTPRPWSGSSQGRRPPPGSTCPADPPRSSPPAAPPPPRLAEAPAPRRGPRCARGRLVSPPPPQPPRCGMTVSPPRRPWRRWRRRGSGLPGSCPGACSPRLDENSKFSFFLILTAMFGSRRCEFGTMGPRLRHSVI
jgi:hypothetical protein